MFGRANLPSQLGARRTSAPSVVRRYAYFCVLLQPVRRNDAHSPKVLATRQVYTNAAGLAPRVYRFDRRTLERGKLPQKSTIALSNNSIGRRTFGDLVSLYDALAPFSMLTKFPAFVVTTSAFDHTSKYNALGETPRQSRASYVLWYRI